MKLFLKILLGIFSLIVIIAIGFAVTFNPNDYKDNIITLVHDNTGRQLSIPGDISLSLFPWIGLSLGEVEISNAKGFAKKPFAKISHLQVRAKVLPLLQQRLEADTLVIQGLTLNLAKNKNGISNWADLSQNKNTESTKTKALEKTTQNDPINILAAFALNGIEISQAQFNWDDQQQKQKLSVSNVHLKIGQIRPETVIPFSTQFDLKQKILSTKIDFKSGILFSNNLKQVSFHNTKLNTETKLAALKKIQTATLGSKLINLDLDKKTAKSKNVKLSSNGAEINIQFTAKNILSNPYVQAQLNVETLNPRTLAKSFDVTLPKTSDNKALTKFNTALNIAATSTNINLSKIKLVLDDTEIKGKANIPLSSAPIVHLNINAINIDRYLPTPTKNKNAAKANKNTKALEAVLIPVALLTQVDLSANVKINNLQIKKTKWKNIQISAKAKQGNVVIKPIKLQGYGSNINSSLNVQANKNTAYLALTLDIKNLKSGELLKDFMSIKNLQGLTSINANIMTQGIKLSQIKKNLKGNVRFSLKNGIVKGVALDYEINKLKAKIKHQAEPAKPIPLQTKFTNLTASATIKNGIINNQDLRAATPFTRIIGRGTVDLVKERLNYITTVKLTNSQDIKHNIPFEKMNSIPLDVNIRGTFDKPSIKANFEKALQSLFKKELKKQEDKLREQAKKALKKHEAEIKAKLKAKEKEAKEKLKNDLNKELEKQLGDKLKGLFKF